MTIHHLKINKQPFDDLVSGSKTCEVRNCSDRDFKVGDRVELFMTEAESGLATESIVRTITHIQRGYGLPDDICVLSYAAPAVERQEPVACTHEWTDDGEFTLACTKCGALENHEPYGWVQTRGDAINAFTQEWDVVQEWEDRGFEYKEMFEHPSPPAPVAVVHPELGSTPEDHMRWLLDKVVNPGDYPQSVLHDQIRSTLACLDKVKELNP